MYFVKRQNFIQIIKLRSFWKIDKRKGNYTLPNGDKLRDYVANLVISQMKVDSLLIRENGNFCDGCGGNWNTDTKEFDNYTLMPAFEANEICTYDEMNRRIERLISEIIG